MQEAEVIQIVTAVASCLCTGLALLIGAVVIYVVIKKLGTSSPAARQSTSAASPQPAAAPAGSSSSGGLDGWLRSSGYRLAGLPAEPLQPHVDGAPDAFKVLGQDGGELVLRREHEGTHANWSQRYGGSAGGYTFANAWAILLDGAPAIPFEVADREFQSSQAGNIRRSWTPTYQGEIRFQDPQLGARFRAYSPHPLRALDILERPDVREALLALTEVDIHVGGEAAVFNDPLQTNVLHALGGTQAMMAMARTDPYAAYTRIQPMHDRVHSLLLALSLRDSWLLLG